MGPIRRVSRWNARKHHYLRRYMSIFAVGMSNQFSRLAYVDLFAGPGLCEREDTGALEQGSPLIALDRPFSEYVFVELDDGDVDALRRRVAAHPNASKGFVIHGNCNSVVDRIRDAIPKKLGLTFAFADPTSFQIRFDTIARLTEGRQVDLLITFHVAGMRRNVDREVRDLDLFFGTKDWRPSVGPQKLVAGDLLEVYRRQLASIGYIFDETIPSIPVRNSTNAIMYYLVFASKHVRGYDFWRKIAAEDERGQRLLEDFT